MRILTCEPYYGGSHRAFLDGWIGGSRHEFTPLTLPPHHWKWRMRHAAWTFAEKVRTLAEGGARWELIFCSSMLNLAEFLGLAPVALRALPCVAYFHENQLTYPDTRKDPRDVHFGLTHLTTALAGEPWFNSAFGRDSLLVGLGNLLASMPDHQSPDLIDRIHRTSRVLPPGIEAVPPRRSPRRPGPMRIAWAARWEHDKNPEAFFEVLDLLAAGGVRFRVSVLGEQFRQSPPVFAAARKRFADRIDHWGFLPRPEYLAALTDADVIVSTALHEFFGLSIVEAAAAGAMPILPKRLAYPELFGLDRDNGAEDLFYDGTVRGLPAKLTDTANRLARTGRVWRGDPDFARRRVGALQWSNHARVLDDALDLAAK